MTRVLSWTNTSDTAYVYYQGRSASQDQAIRYLGGDSMQTTTGETVTIDRGTIQTIPTARLWVYPEINEVDRHAWMGIFARLDHWFNGVRVAPTDKQRVDGQQPLYPQDESGSLEHYAVIHAKASLAQETDIRSHKEKYDALIKAHPNVENVVLYGVSRGAATSFRAMARYKENYDRVKLCVLEAPPANILDLFKFYFTKYIGKWLYNSVIAHLFLGHQHQADPKDQAIGDVEDFPDHIPLLIISSKKDTIVPHTNCLKLAAAVAAKRQGLRHAGNQVAPVYFLQLDNPNHNDYWSGRYEEDTSRYEAIVHAVYRKHGLPHSFHEASLAETELELIDLVAGPLATQVQFQALFKKNKELRSAIVLDAQQQLKEQLQDMPAWKQQRAVGICSYMRMYKDHTIWHGDALKQPDTEDAAGLGVSV